METTLMEHLSAELTKYATSVNKVVKDIDITTSIQFVENPDVCDECMVTIDIIQYNNTDKKLFIADIEEIFQMEHINIEDNTYIFGVDFLSLRGVSVVDKKSIFTVNFTFAYADDDDRISEIMGYIKSLCEFGRSISH